MSAALKAYDNSAQTDQFYEDFAWQGLKDTESFREKGLQEIRRIESVWHNYMNSGNKNYN